MNSHCLYLYLCPLELIHTGIHLGILFDLYPVAVISLLLDSTSLGQSTTASARSPVKGSLVSESTRRESAEVLADILSREDIRIEARVRVAKFLLSVIKVCPSLSARAVSGLRIMLTSNVLHSVLVSCATGPSSTKRYHDEGNSSKEDDDYIEASKSLVEFCNRILDSLHSFEQNT